MRLTLVALSLSLLAAPVAASAQSTQGATPKNSRAAAAKAKIYCFEVEPTTGSRITRRECNTKSQWEALGVEFDKIGKQ
jgi:hypothetical protein